MGAKVGVFSLRALISLILALASPLIESAWKGRLVHLAGLDVIGATAGSLSRLVQDREVELWEGKRMVSDASVDEVSPSMCIRS